MPTIKIDNQEYELDTLPDAAKSQLQMLQYIDAEIVRNNAQSAMLQTARAAYFNSLKAELPLPPGILDGDTIKFG